MTAENRLRAALAMEPAPAIDPAFTARVMEAVERRRLWLRLAVAALWAGVAALLLWTLRPVLAEAGSTLGPLVQQAAGLVVVGMAAWMAWRADRSGWARRVGRMARFGR